jgi:hypothetical protein
LRRLGPDPRETIGLQFHPHRERISRAGILALQVAYLGFDPEKVLNVMAEFVGENVGLRELAGGPKPALQFIIKAEIDVDLLIRRTLERPGRRLGCAAA